MSHFDNLVTTIADALLAEADRANTMIPGAPTASNDIDVTDPAAAYVDGVLDLRVVASRIVTAGWVHADEVNRLRAAVDRVRAIEADWGRHAPRYSMHSALAANQLKRALDGGA